MEEEYYQIEDDNGWQSVFQVSELAICGGNSNMYNYNYYIYIYIYIYI